MRESCRVIVIKNNQLVVMYREKNGKAYYVFPGGGKDEGETLVECAKREALEEFGIEVSPTKKVYEYSDSGTLQHFFVADWIGGELGGGQGEEFEEGQTKGVYIPMLIDISKLADYNILPAEVKQVLVKDLEVYGVELGDSVQVIKGIF